MKIVIEAGAEVTLKAGGSFVKVDPSGVTISGPLVRMNSGGGPGSGSGVGVKLPELAASPAIYEQSVAESPKLATPSLRPEASINASRISLLREAAAAGSLSVSSCEYDENGRCKLHKHTG